MIVGGVELGGTKIRVARGTPGGRIEHCDTFATAGPEESFARILGYFRESPSVAAIGAGGRREAFFVMSSGPSSGRSAGRP